MTVYSVRQLNAIVDEYAESDRLKKDKEATLVVATRAPHLLVYADKTLLADSEVAITAVKANGQSLRFFSEEVRSNVEIVKIAVNNFCKSFAFAIGDARKNVEIAKIIASRGGETIALLDEELLDNAEIAEIAVNRNPKTLAYFSEKVRSDEKVVVCALEKDRTCVEFISDSAFKNKRIFEKVLRVEQGKIACGVLNQNSPQGLYDRIEELGMQFNLATQSVDLLTIERDKLRVCLKCGVGTILKKGELFRKYVEKEDREIILTLLERVGYSSKFLIEEVKFASQNRKLRILPILLKATGGINVNAVKEKDERMFMMRSLRRKSPTAVARFKENYNDYLADRELVFTAARADGTIIKVLTNTEYINSVEFVTECLKSYVVKNSDGAILDGLNVVLNDEQAKLACKKDGRNYFFVTNEQKNNLNLAEIAVNSCPTIFEKLSPEIQKGLIEKGVRYE